MRCQCIFDHPAVRGALVSLVGAGHLLNPHHHIHLRLPGASRQGESARSPTATWWRFVGTLRMHNILKSSDMCMLQVGTKTPTFSITICGSQDSNGCSCCTVS